MKIKDIYIYLGIFVWSVIVITTLICSFPVLPVSLPFHFKSKVTTLLPQGWGFFTRNPREEDRNAYIVVDNELVSMHTPVLTINGDFGINRDQRALFSEIGILANQVPDTCWVSCKGDIENIVRLNFSVSKVKDNISYKQLKGIVYLVKKESVPWAWSSTIRKNGIERNYKVAKVDVI